MRSSPSPACGRVPSVASSNPCSTSESQLGEVCEFGRSSDLEAHPRDPPRLNASALLAPQSRSGECRLPWTVDRVTIAADGRTDRIVRASTGNPARLSVRIEGTSGDVVATTVQARVGVKPSGRCPLISTASLPEWPRGVLEVVRAADSAARSGVALPGRPARSTCDAYRGVVVGPSGEVLLLAAPGAPDSQHPGSCAATPPRCKTTGAARRSGDAHRATVHPHRAGPNAALARLDSPTTRGGPTPPSISRQARDRGGSTDDRG